MKLARLAPPVVAAVAVVAAIAAVMSHSEPRLAGTNDVSLAGFPVLVEPGQRFCQAGEHIPPGAARMQLTVGTEGRPGPPLALTVGGRPARVPAGYADGAPVDVPVPGGAEGSATVCVRNLGDDRVFLGGQDAAASALPPGLSARLGDEPVAVVAQLAYWRGGEESGWEIAGAAIERWGLVTALGAATPWLALIAFAGACLAAVALAARGRAGALAC
ncbi:MAG: hypothetical protein ACRDPC_16320, partial [Solirubrobacteraceae bacterium]